MSNLQTQIPSSVWVAQAPLIDNKDQMEIWLRQLATWVQGAQSVKEWIVLQGGAPVGKCFAIRLGHIVWVQASIKLLADPQGTDTVVKGIPVEAAAETFLSAIGASHVMLAQDSKEITIVAPTGTDIMYSGWYLGALLKR
jgi:hypothetical protein